MNNKFEFTHNTMTCNGKVFPVEYSVTPSGAVVVCAKVDDSKNAARIRFNPDHPYHAAARAAALNEQPAAAADDERPATIPEQPVAPVEAPEEQPAPALDEQPAAPAAAAPVEQPAERDPKQARGTVPEKTFVDTSIDGACYRILFDGKTQRTRVIIPEEYREKARATVEKAGFYFSPIMESWNKKLTFKAYRAAQALAAELDKVFAA